MDPAAFFEVFGEEVLDEVPPLPGEQAMYDWFRSVLQTDADAPKITAALKQAALDADAMVGELFEFRNYGIPLARHWSTQHTGAAFGTDYLMRTAVGKSNIFVNTANETTYYYQDLDDQGERLDGSNTYTVHFKAGQLPPVRGFWSLTVYDKHHFFHPNELGRFSLGTKNKNLAYGQDGSLTLGVGGEVPSDPALHAN
ncbi:DUF1214 domain-containing protein [Nonomuraea sp. NPDC047529]|uniref:DUF1214 domain-containing protein n=1 Tax=Nonomuraea sp. NPDC047529 TaxID=3155623 RepID=UPI0033DBA23D